MSGSVRKQEIKSNTAFRGIGAMFVMLHHLGEIKTGPGQVSNFFSLGANADVVLDMFFLLSGFIMAYIYAETFGSGVSGKAVGKFLWFRFARVYPLHIFAILVYLAERGAYIVAYAIHGSFADVAVPPAIFYTDPNLANTPYTLLANVLLIHAWGFTSQVSWNYPSWASSAEFSAYLLFPFMCLLIGRLGRTGLVILVGCSLAGYVALYTTFGTLNISPTIGALRTIPGFMMGVALFMVSSPLAGMSTRSVNVAQTIALAVAVVAFSTTHNQLILVATMAGVLWATTQNRGWVSGVLSWRPLQFLGRISFTIYTLHVIVGKPMFPIFNALGGKLGVADQAWWLYVTLVAACLATIVASVFAYRYVELPARFALDKLVKRPARAAATPLSPVAAESSEPRRS
jgi:peptidoglycan/LPS O-acetylase OafA/YrhL